MKPLKLLAISATVVAAIFTTGTDAALAASAAPVKASSTATHASTTHSSSPAHVSIVQATYQGTNAPSTPRKPGSDWPWPG